MTARMRLHGVGQSIGGWKSPWLPWLSVSRLYLYHKSNDQYTTEKHDYAFICAVSGGLLHMKTFVWLSSGWPSCGKCSFGCTIWVLWNLTSNSVASGWLVATVDGELCDGPEVAWAVQQLGLFYQAHILCTIYCADQWQPKLDQPIIMRCQPTPVGGFICFAAAWHTRPLLNHIIIAGRPLQLGLGWVVTYGHALVKL